jgi:hypothetical protein
MDAYLHELSINSIKFLHKTTTIINIDKYDRNLGSFQQDIAFNKIEEQILINGEKWLHM